MIVGGSRCVLADGECRGRLEWHHAVKQQRLKREFPYGAWWDDDDGQVGRWRRADRHDPVTPDDCANCCTLDDILGDTRNRIWLCSHHHELVTNGRLHVEVPESVWEFAAEFGFTAQLENDLARRAA